MDVKSPDWMTRSITSGHCPDCKYRGFVIGPQAPGKQVSSINIECGNVDCRSRFNAAFYSGDVVFCHRIEGGVAWPSEPAASTPTPNG
jgi:hypothetical protein